LFPQLDPMVVDLPLAFLGYGGLLFASLCYFFVLAGLFISRCLIRRSGQAIVSSTGWFLAGFFTFFLWFLEAKSTLFRRLLIDTGSLAAFPSVFHPCLCKLRSCRSSVIGALWCAWGRRSSFFRPCTIATGSTASDLSLGGSDESACPTRAAVRHLWPHFPLPAACFLVFLLFCVCVIILFFSSHNLLVFISNFMKIFVG
jgi:hypothetical protein